MYHYYSVAMFQPSVHVLLYVYIWMCLVHFNILIFQHNFFVAVMIAFNEFHSTDIVTCYLAFTSTDMLFSVLKYCFNVI